MVTSGKLQFGQMTSVWGIAPFNMEACTKKLMVLNRPHAMETFKAPMRLASGVTGVLAMEQ